jgi:hypothetical protein
MKQSAQVLIRPDGMLRCPHCGGGQFQPKRSTGRKVAFGFASLLGSTNEVRCVTCAATFSTSPRASGSVEMTPPQPPRPDVYP